MGAGRAIKHPTFSITSINPALLPPGGEPPVDNSNDSDPDDEKPTQSQRPSGAQMPRQTMQSTFSMVNCSDTRLIHRHASDISPHGIPTV